MIAACGLAAVALLPWGDNGQAEAATWSSPTARAGSTTNAEIETLEDTNIRH
jgi:hypothetical protein